MDNHARYYVLYCSLLCNYPWSICCVCVTSLECPCTLRCLILMVVVRANLTIRVMRTRLAYQYAFLITNLSCTRTSSTAFYLLLNNSLVYYEPPPSNGFKRGGSWWMPNSFWDYGLANSPYESAACMTIAWRMIRIRWFEKGRPRMDRMVITSEGRWNGTYSSAGFTLIAMSTNCPFSLSNMKCDRHELES